MRKKFKLSVALSVVATFAAALFFHQNPTHTRAMENYVDGEGQEHYGWSLVANEINQSVWQFDEEGFVDYIYAAEGDTANQRIYNYAFRNLAIDQEAEYEVQATFTPDPESDLSVERAYGIVPWYQDADNYLIYWMQQKIGGDWSGQFYGRIDGAFRKMWVPTQYGGAIPSTDYWLKGEYYDMWWDSSYAHSLLRNSRNMLLTETITLHVESKLDTATVGAESGLYRRFAVKQTVQDVEETLCVFYIEQINDTSGSFYTGLYSEAFSVGISEFILDVKDATFVSDVEAIITALPAAISAVSEIDDVIVAHTAFENLLDMKANVAPASVTKLENAEKAVGAYVDSRILALDESSPTFVADVDVVVELYSALPDYLAMHVTELEALIAAINAVQNPPASEVPSESEAPVSSAQTSTSDEAVSTPTTGSEITSEPDAPKTGCFAETIVGTVSVVMMLAVAMVFIIYRRNKLG